MSDLHAVVRADQDRMLSAFVQLDREERTARLLLEDYGTYLPDRARTTSLLERHRRLQEEVTALTIDYLTLVDAYPPPEELRPPRLQEAGMAFRDMAVRMEEMAGRLTGLLEGADPELRRLGAAKASVERLRAQVGRDAAAAERAAADLAAAGLACTAVDRALDEVRAAAREAAAWTPALPTEALEEAARRGREASEEAVRAAADYPEQVAGLPVRAKSLRTRLDALQNRAETVPGDLGRLRRSYRAADWMDLDGNEEAAATVLDRAREACARLDVAVSERRFDEALTLTDAVKSTLDEAAELVDAPSQRLVRLDDVSKDPKAAVQRARFAVRDAQMMVQAGSPAQLRAFAPELDRLAARVDAARASASSGSTAWWPILQELDRVRDEVTDLVARYRATRA